jgi:hypothetical protein
MYVTGRPIMVHIFTHHGVPAAGFERLARWLCGGATPPGEWIVGFVGQVEGWNDGGTGLLGGKEEWHGHVRVLLEFGGTG